MIRYRKDLDGNRHRVVIVNGMDGFEVRYTTSCSGCFEPGECGALAHHYIFDSKAGCHIGSGCHECGYTGKRARTYWVPFDYADAASLCAT